MKMEEIPIDKKRIIFVATTSLWFIIIGFMLLIKLNPFVLGISLLVVGIPSFMGSINLYE